MIFMRSGSAAGPRSLPFLAVEFPFPSGLPSLFMRWIHRGHLTLTKYLEEKDLDLTATLDGAAAYRDADFVIIAAPTNYDSKKNFFDCSAVEA